ncbi:UNVERIFIED_CONTAM: hypothetical protein H355_000143, partial [Colinus virginianus]
KGSGLNLLINNAGILRKNTLDNETLKDMSEVYTTNTIGPLLMSQAALNMLTRCQSMGYREHGILCVGFHPGWVKTDMGKIDGYTAQLTVDESVGGMLKVLSSLSEKDTGTVLDWEGNVVPWELQLQAPGTGEAGMDYNGTTWELQKLASKHRNLVIVPLEVTDPASIKAAAASVREHLKGSGLNLLINNAGIVREITLENETLKDMSDVYMTNTIAPLLLSQAFLPLLKKAAQESPGSGLSCSKAAIVNISSIAGSIKEMYLWEVMQIVSYRCSKAAQNMLTRCQSLGYREHGILCVALHPGWVQTDMGNSVGDKAFLPLLKKAAQESPGSGLSCSKAAIVNISSIGGSIKEMYLWEAAQCASYRCSKAALNMLTRCQSLGYREHGILCVAVHPGWVQTDMGNAGGHTAQLTVDASVGGMLKVLSSLSEKDTGTFLDWEGNKLPW